MNSIQFFVIFAFCFSFGKGATTVTDAADVAVDSAVDVVFTLNTGLNQTATVKFNGENVGAINATTTSVVATPEGTLPAGFTAIVEESGTVKVTSTVAADFNGKKLTFESNVDAENAEYTFSVKACEAHGDTIAVDTATGTGCSIENYQLQGCTVEFKCVDGHTGTVGGGILTVGGGILCNKAAAPTWASTLPTCTAACTLPEGAVVVGATGTANCSHYAADCESTFMCQADYVLDGDGKRTCNADATAWTNTDSPCSGGIAVTPSLLAMALLMFVSKMLQ